MCIGITILTVEEETAAALRIQVPEQNAKATFGQEAGQVYRCGGFSNASLDIIYSNLFQNLNLITKL